MEKKCCRKDSVLEEEAFRGTTKYTYAHAQGQRTRTKHTENHFIMMILPPTLPSTSTDLSNNNDEENSVSGPNTPNHHRLTRPESRATSTTTTTTTRTTATAATSTRTTTTRSNPSSSSYFSICHGLMRNDACWTLVNLNCTPLGNDGAALLARALQYNTHVIVLFLNQTRLQGASAAWQSLATAVAHHEGLDHLYLSYNPELGTRGIQVLAQAFVQAHEECQQQQQQQDEQQEQQQQRSITVSSCNGNYSHTNKNNNDMNHHKKPRLLAAGSSSSSLSCHLRVLKLAHCEVGDEACAALGKWLQQGHGGCNLQTLDLQHYHIGPIGLTQLAQSLQSSQSTRLQSLDVRYNTPLASSGWSMVTPNRLHHRRRRSSSSGSSSSSTATSSSLATMVPTTWCTVWQTLAEALGPQHHNTTLSHLELTAHDEDVEDDGDDDDEEVGHPAARRQRQGQEQQRRRRQERDCRCCRSVASIPQRSTQAILGTGIAFLPPTICCPCQTEVQLYLTLNRWGRARFGEGYQISPWAWSFVLAKPSHAQNCKSSNAGAAGSTTFSALTAVSFQNMAGQEQWQQQQQQQQESNDVVTTSFSASLIFYLLRTRPDLLFTTSGDAGDGLHNDTDKARMQKFEM